MHRCEMPNIRLQLQTHRMQLYDTRKSIQKCFRRYGKVRFGHVDAEKTRHTMSHGANVIKTMENKNKCICVLCALAKHDEQKFSSSNELTAAKKKRNKIHRNSRKW